jgi:hypothetical protein
MNFEFGSGVKQPPPGCKYVDLAELSLSGSLMPSVPTRLAIKYSPPLMTIVYHFEQNAEEFYYHDIPIERQMLATLGAEDIVSHLYMREAYYFNPKQVKRAQLVKLVKML